MCSEDPGWKRLISPALVMDERISLITMIFSDNNQAEMAEHLSGDNMQMFINQIDEASPAQSHVRRSRWIWIQTSALCFLGIG